MKTIFACLLLVAAFNGHLFAQTVEEKPMEEVLDIGVVEQPAEYPGGIPALMEFLSKNVVYPKECAEKSIEGKVYVEFVIGVDGGVGHIRIKRGVDKLLDEEAMRVVGIFPKWTPATHLGKRVPCKFVLPVNFKLKGDENPTEIIIDETRK
ncbi:MAG TPA: energy transducer TonB [Flavobacteriales bacterium]|nr:energy transducer TonB [Flavobacteriales bacterium]